MADVTWKLSMIYGVESGDTARLVQLTASHVSEEFPGHSMYQAEVLVPAGLTDVREIERAAYERVRRYLPDLARALSPAQA